MDAGDPSHRQRLRRLRGLCLDKRVREQKLGRTQLSKAKILCSSSPSSFFLCLFLVFDLFFLFHFFDFFLLCLYFSLIFFFIQLSHSFLLFMFFYSIPLSFSLYFFYFTFLFFDSLLLLFKSFSFSIIKINKVCT